MINTTIAQLSLRNSAGLLLAHSMAFDLAKKSGLSEINCLKFLNQFDEQLLGLDYHAAEITFAINENQEGQFYLEAVSGDGLVTSAKLERSPGPAAFNMTSTENPEAKQAIEKLAEQNTNIRRFTFAIAHDLKNSLTKYKLALSLLDEEEVPEHLAYYLDIIKRSTGMFEETTQTLQELIQFEAALPPSPTIIDVKELANTTMDALRTTYSESNPLLTLDIQGVDNFSFIEPYLRSILTELVTNSLKFKSSDRSPEITIGIKRIADTLHIHIVDNGHGFDTQAAKDKLFVPFTKITQERKGKGIGLYMVKQMLERNGGQIIIESEPGKGTSVKCVLREYEPN